MRPVPKEWPMIFGFKKRYPPNVAAVTGLQYHWGQDFACPTGTAVNAGVDGIWLGAKVHRGYGYMAEILFSTGNILTKTYYILRLAHLLYGSDPKRQIGSKISKLDIVGKSDSTGAATYSDGPGLPIRPHPHLHVECWKCVKSNGIWIRTELVSPAFVTQEELA